MKPILIVTLILIGGAVGYLIAGQVLQKSATPSLSAPTASSSIGNPISGALNASYGIDNQQITLANGKSEIEVAPGSASKIETMSWGEPAIGDLDADGSNDAALILTQSGGGSGTFFYVVAAVWSRETKKYTGTNGVLLGDRVSPENISIEKGAIVVNYADRKQGEPMSTPPSVGVTKRLRIEGTMLVDSANK